MRIGSPCPFAIMRDDSPGIDGELFPHLHLSKRREAVDQPVGAGDDHGLGCDVRVRLGYDRIDKRGLKQKMYDNRTIQREKVKCDAM